MKKKTSLGRKIFYGVLAFIAIFIILKVTGIFKNRAILVETEKVSFKDLVEIVTASGKIQPEQEVRISPDVSGEIIELSVVLGQRVKKGELLLKIQPDIYLAAVNQSKAAVNNIKAQLRASEAAYKQAQTKAGNAHKNFERNKELFAKQIISQADFDISEMEYLLAEQQSTAAFEQLQSARFSVENAESSLKEAQDRLARTIIFAPINGTISSLIVEKGERVVGTNQMAGTEIMRIANLKIMEVLVEVSEIDITRISNNDSAYIEIDAFPNRIFRGVITEIAQSAKNSGSATFNEQSSTFEIKARIVESSYKDLVSDTAQAPFMPGMSAMIDIITARHKNVASVPILAVTTKEMEKDSSKTSDKLEQQEMVFVYDDGIAKERLVKTGIQDDFYIEITDGLQEGDVVIKGPYDAVTISLKDGKKVERKK